MSWIDLYALAFDTYINLRFAIAEAVRQLGYRIEDALDSWGEEDDE